MQRKPHKLRWERLKVPKVPEDVKKNPEKKAQWDAYWSNQIQWWREEVRHEERRDQWGDLDERLR